jgi:hypothetical protein
MRLVAHCHSRSERLDAEGGQERRRPRSRHVGLSVGLGALLLALAQRATDRCQKTVLERAPIGIFYPLGAYCGPANGREYQLAPIDGLDAVCAQHDYCIERSAALQHLYPKRVGAHARRGAAQPQPQSPATHAGPVDAHAVSDAQARAHFRAVLSDGLDDAEAAAAAAVARAGADGADGARCGAPLGAWRLGELAAQIAECDLAMLQSLSRGRVLCPPAGSLLPRSPTCEQFEDLPICADAQPSLGAGSLPASARAARAGATLARHGAVGAYRIEPVGAGADGRRRRGAEPRALAQAEEPAVAPSRLPPWRYRRWGPRGLLCRAAAGSIAAYARGKVRRNVRYHSARAAREEGSAGEARRVLGELAHALLRVGARGDAAPAPERRYYEALVVVLERQLGQPLPLVDAFAPDAGRRPPAGVGDGGAGGGRRPAGAGPPRLLRTVGRAARAVGKPIGWLAGGWRRPRTNAKAGP